MSLNTNDERIKLSVKSSNYNIATKFASTSACSKILRVWRAMSRCDSWVGCVDLIKSAEGGPGNARDHPGDAPEDPGPLLKLLDLCRLSY